MNAQTPDGARAPRIPGRRLLHSPGPTPVPDAVLQAMSCQPMDLADPRVDANIAAVERGLRWLVGSPDSEVFLYAGNGHGAWEAVVENVADLGQTVLVAGTGHFSESWAVQTEGLGRRVLRTPWREGEPIDTEALEQALRADREHAIRAVFAVHTDTASGVTSDLGAVRRALDAAAHPALLVADGVASLAAEPLDMDALGVDVVLGASQKGLMCPPGVAFVLANARALAVAEANPAPRFYWSWPLRRSSLSYRKACGTPPQNLLFGLQAALELLAAEGLPAVHARHALLAGAVHAAVAGWAQGGALGFFAHQPAVRSVSVTSVTVPPGTDVEGLRRLARERFQVSIAGGLGPLAGRVFRIGHLGDQNPAQMLGALGGVEAALRVLSLPVGDGVGCAVRYLVSA